MAGGQISMASDLAPAASAVIGDADDLSPVTDEVPELAAPLVPHLLPALLLLSFPRRCQESILRLMALIKTRTRHDARRTQRRSLAGRRYAAPPHLNTTLFIITVASR